MTVHWSKRQVIFRIVLIIFCSMLYAICYLLCPDKADSGQYRDSAHGNTGYGVLRTSLSTAPYNYNRGNCVHCHEQHASIGGTEPAPNSPAGPDSYLLFQDLWTSPIQSNVFCYGCHRGNNSYQSIPSPQNFSYSYTAGGDTINLGCPGTIYDSFQFINNSGASQSNCGSSVGSSHRFGDFTPLRGNWGFSNDLNAINPCSACHNPHKAKKDFPVSRPSAHTDKYAWDVWGDDPTTERMNIFTSNLYLSPKRVGGGFEPHGFSTPAEQDGSNTVDYVSLCTDCHNTNITIYSTRLGRNLTGINWGAGGDAHGFGPRRNIQSCSTCGTPSPSTGNCDSVCGWLTEPYQNTTTGSFPKPNYVLNCTDCHEPHGSRNEFLLRAAVNGVTGLNIDPVTPNTSGCWQNFCTACHGLNGNAFTPHNSIYYTYVPCGSSPTSGQKYTCYGASCHQHCTPGICGATDITLPRF